MRSCIIDAGPIVAYLSAREGKLHEWAIAQFSRFTAFDTCDAVIAEACARVAYYGGPYSAVIELIRESVLRVDFDLTRSAARVVDLMDKYSDQPMDLADACIVTMSEQERDCVVLTLDKEDFSVYRRFGRDRIPILTP